VKLREGAGGRNPGAEAPARWGRNFVQSHAGTPAALMEFTVLALVVGLIVGELVALGSGLWDALAKQPAPVEAHERSV